MAAEATVGGVRRVRTAVTPVSGLAAVVLTHHLTNASARAVRFTAATGLFAESAAVLHGKGSWLGWVFTPKPRNGNSPTVSTTKCARCPSGSQF